MRAAEPGALAPFVGGATWRGLRIETKADLSGLSTRPQGTITITGGADDISLAAVDKRLPALGAVTLASDLGLGADGKITVAVPRYRIGNRLGERRRFVSAGDPGR